MLMPPAMFTNTSSRDQVQAGALLEHRQQQRQAVLIDAHRHAPRLAVAAGADERLHFDQQRPRAFEAAQHRRTRRRGRALGEEQRRGIGHRPQPGAGHLEHAQLAGRAEPVLDRADDAMRVMPLAFEIEHGVDHVLERLGAGEAAVLRDVADQERRDVVALRGEQELRGRFAHLADAAGRRLELQREHRLDRVDDHQRRLDAADFLEDALDAGLGKQVERRVADAEAIAARLDLVLGFFARGIEHRADRLREVRGRLQQQRGLADAGLAAEQDQRAGNDAAAEHAIELADAGA